MVNRVDTAMSYPHKEVYQKFNAPKKPEKNDFQKILDENIQKLKGGKENGKRKGL